MTALRNFLVAILVALAGGAIALPLSDWLTDLYHVSNFEGQRGYAVIFVFLPIGLLTGFGAGLVAAIKIKRRGGKGFFETLAMGLALILVIAIFTGATLYALADKPPRINGHPLVLEFEARIPPAIRVPIDLKESPITGSLYVDNRQNRLVEIDETSVTQRDGYTFLRGRVELMSHGRRTLLLSVGNAPEASQFIEVKLPSSPRPMDENWSDWTQAVARFDLTPVPSGQQLALRYRVQEVSD